MSRNFYITAAFASAVMAYTPAHTTATTTTSEAACTESVCIDATNSCGVWYGGCTTYCSGSFPTFTPPPCSTTPKPITTTTPPPTTSHTGTCTESLCVDAINSCGMTYGGCVPYCTGDAFPTFTPPPCPTTTPKPITTSSSTKESCTETVCVDAVNDCGMTYGGCVPYCTTDPLPTFTPPPCPKTTVMPPTTTAKPGNPDACCETTVCADFINTCGQTYGGCFPACGEGFTTPVFEDPGCPITTSMHKPPVTTDVIHDPTITPKPTTTSCPSLCRDYFDDCGNTYGPGCYTSCPGATEPAYETPSCSLTTDVIHDPTIITTTATPTITSDSISIITPITTGCPYLCRDYFDDCGNTYGPGCYTSCPGATEPTYTTPSCSATTTASVIADPTMTH